MQRHTLPGDALASWNALLTEAKIIDREERRLLSERLARLETTAYQGLSAIGGTLALGLMLLLVIATLGLRLLAAAVRERLDNAEAEELRPSPHLEAP